MTWCDGGHMFSIFHVFLLRRLIHILVIVTVKHTKMKTKFINRKTEKKKQTSV